MATTEHTINDALAAVLRETRYAWSTSEVVSSENIGMLKGNLLRMKLAQEPSIRGQKAEDKK